MQEENRGDASRKPPLRLPIIAPKDDHSSSASSSSRGGKTTTGPSVPPRARLPPRSRTGCWTCRTRKVKCDEGRPICGQCTRLGHNCDYSPRLSFRDDTPRVVERMQEVSIVGSSIWDGQQSSPVQRFQADCDTASSPVLTETSTGSAPFDDLPPFAQLFNDEDREKKAERSSPGTYHVIVNPDSFQHMPEYSDDDAIKRDHLSPFRRGSIATSLASSLGKESSAESIIPPDPNIVVLPKFEDVARRQTGKEPLSPNLRRIKTEEDDAEKLSEAEMEASEERYIRQFREAVWRQLVPAEIDQLNGMEHSSAFIVENEAQFFPPVCSNPSLLTWLTF